MKQVWAGVTLARDFLSGEWFPQGAEATST